ncbi:MAG: efflux RND transporter periplasmic adaptor subunit [Pseudomonadota bacterium]
MKVLKRIAVESFWLVVAVGIIVGGYLGFQALGQMREVVEAAPVERSVPLVDTLTLEAFVDDLPVDGEGFIRPSTSVDVSTQISGRISALHDAIQNRGSFLKGDVLVQLDDRSQRAAVEQIKANIDAAEATLGLVETQLNRSQQLLDRAIIPQERVDQLTAQRTELTANLTALRASLQSALVQVENTKVVALFDGTVLSKTSDLGAVVNPGQTIASVYANDALEVMIPISESEASVIQGLFGARKPEAVVRSNFAGVTFEWDAMVDRVESSLDAQTRTVRLAIKISDPAKARPVGTDGALASGTPPALINAFASVTIKGGRYDNLYAVPSTAVRNGNSVWLAEDGKMAVHPARLVHVDGERSFIQLTDLDEKTELITSALAAPATGRPIQVVQRTAEVQGAEVSQ